MAYVLPEPHMDGGGGGGGGEEGGAAEDTISLPGPQPQGSVYFDVRAFEAVTAGRTRYGKLAPDAASTDFFAWEDLDPAAEGGTSPARRKRDPRDFCLWKYRPRTPPPLSAAADVDEDAATVEPSSVSYASPWGPGRPGWHVECSAMIQRLADDLRSTHAFGVHAGGTDLRFPHHCNEIAQAEAYAAAAGGGREGEGEGAFDEWIPHWIHTGHLYIQGRKMSKSLKNFVTIREMLGTAPAAEGAPAASPPAPEGDDAAAAAWSAPADDFRLWVLGLSGAYRGPATYGPGRMAEARATREKWVRFLVEGRELLARQGSPTEREEDGDASTRLWGEEELRLFRDFAAGERRCRRALLDDLDGVSFVRELGRMAEAGRAYVGGARAQEPPRRPEEPLRFALDTFRRLLEVVGFSSRTVDAGLSSGGAAAATSRSAPPVVDAVVAFRAAVRATALDAVRGKAGGPEALKRILALCDEMRDDTFPRLGVEIRDGKGQAGEHGAAWQGDWRHCTPSSKA